MRPLGGVSDWEGVALIFLTLSLSLSLSPCRFSLTLIDSLDTLAVS